MLTKSKKAIVNATTISSRCLKIKGIVTCVHVTICEGTLSNDYRFKSKHGCFVWSKVPRKADLKSKKLVKTRLIMFGENIA